MGCHIIIDGYNLIGSENGLKGNLEGKRKLLIHKLQEYQQKKGHTVTVVFDGWRAGWRQQIEELSGGITIIFSQLGEQADSVIQKLASRIGSGCAVVTSDREIRSAIEANDAVPIFAQDFIAKLNLLDQPDPFYNNTMLPSPQKFSFQGKGKKGNPKKLSKTDRRRIEMLKKL